MKRIIRLLPFLFGCLLVVSCTSEIDDTDGGQTDETEKPQCNSGKVEMEIIDTANDFSIIYRYRVDDFAVGFTNEGEEKWQDQEWLDRMYKTLNAQTKFNVVILFNNHDHTPNLNIYCLDYPSQFNRNLVLGYWRFPDGKNKFCWGGPKVDGTFYHCDYKD